MSCKYYGCSGLTSITIPNSVTTIDYGTFSGCSGLTSITIPNSVTSIGSLAFYGCSGLTSITIPNSVTTIDYGTFSGCSGLTSITIPNSVTSIGSSAFYNTPWYNNQPDGMVYAGNVAYKYKGTMPNNTEIIIKDGTTGITGSAFSGCNGLTSITIPNSVTSIGREAFSGCSGLTAVHITDLASWCNISFGNHDSNPLYYAHHLYLNGVEVSDLVIPNSVTRISDKAFSGCSGLTSITIPNSVTSIGYLAFYGCSGLTSVTIPNSVTSIGDEAFYGCSGLTSIAIPNSVTSIGHKTFYECTNLTSVRIGNNITSIPYGTFENFTNLTSIIIGDGVLKIEDKAFSGDKNLETIISVSPTPPNIYHSDTFETTTFKHAILKVPLGCKSRYWNAKYWEDFAYIEEMDMTAYREGIDMEEGEKPSLYASFYNSQSAYVLPVGMKASVVTGISKGKLVYKVIAEGGKTNNVVPKGVAVMLTSQTDDASAYTLTPTESAATYTDTNWLHGSDLATTTTADGGNYWFYKLSYGASGSAQSDVFGWYWGAANGGAFSIAGHKAWLAVPKAAGAPVRSFAFDGEDIGWDETTDIENVEVQNHADDSYYDLQGRRIEKPTMRGIYIHNGKKIMIK